MKNCLLSLLFSITLLNSFNSHAHRPSKVYDFFIDTNDFEFSLMKSGFLVSTAGYISLMALDKGGSLVIVRYGEKLRPAVNSIVEGLGSVTAFPMMVGVVFGGMGSIMTVKDFVSEQFSKSDKEAYLKAYKRKKMMVVASKYNKELLLDSKLMEEVNSVTCKSCENDSEKIERYQKLYKGSQKVGLYLSQIVDKYKESDDLDKTLSSEFLKDEKLKKVVKDSIGEEISKENLNLLAHLSLESMIANSIQNK